MGLSQECKAGSTLDQSSMISTGAENALDKIQPPVLMKTLSKVGTEGNYLNLIELTAGTAPMVKGRMLQP